MGKLPFSASEREFIITLVGERPIIEDKRINSQNVELKKKAWEELTIAFNSQEYVTPRSTMQLKRCWENIKSQRKKELSRESTSFHPESYMIDIKKFHNEIETRVKRSTVNMQQDTELHELRLKKERVLIKREENLLEYEKQIHSLQKEKIKLEIELLKKKLQN